MNRSIASLNFAHLRRSDSLFLQEAVSEKQNRNLIAQKLELFLVDLKNARSIDEERLFVLGVQIASIWPGEFKDEIVQGFRASENDRAISAFLKGFNYVSQSEALGRSSTPTRMELDELCRRIQVEQVQLLSPQIDQTLAKYRTSMNRYGDSTYLTRALQQIGLALLRNPERYPAAEIAEQLASECIQLNPRFTGPWILWARSLISLEAATAAELVLWEASRLHPYAPHILTRLSYCIARTAERLPEAIALARSSAARLPQPRGLLLVLANLLHWTGTAANRKEAVDILLGVINKNDSDYFAITLLAKILVESSPEPYGINFIIERLPRSPRCIGHVGQHINNIDPGSGLAESIFRHVIQHFPDNRYAPNQLARVLAARNDPNLIDEIITILKTAHHRLPSDAFTANNLAAKLASTKIPENISEAITILQKITLSGTSDETTKGLLQRLSAGESVSPITVGPAMREEVDSEADSIEFASPQTSKTGVIRIPSRIAEQGQLRRIRFILESNLDAEKIEAEQSLRLALLQDQVPSYARILAIRHGIWEGQGEELPSFALAFESALHRHDLDLLRSLEQQYPRLDALILIARSLFGDTEASEHIKEVLAQPEKDLHPAIAAFNRLVGTELLAMSDNVLIVSFLKEQTSRVVASLRDSAEMTIVDERKAA